MMTGQNKLLMRTAIAIHERVMPKQHTTESIELPQAAWRQCEDAARRMGKAREHGFDLAAQRFQCDLRAKLGRLRGEVIATDHLLEPPPSRPCTSIGDIYADLVALHDEFDDVSFDRRERTISVTTESIELDGVYLGPFAIRLEWSELTEGRPGIYQVIALDANPAAANDSVTHPHVQDEAVCEGEARQPIRKALEQGRLLDFFVIVANLLRTYNSDSPYVSLSDWRGVDCADCGSTVSDDERWTCEKCETTVCGECYSNCPGCDGIFCSECVTRCEGCDQDHCSACMKQCSRCRAELCQSCLDDKERCSDCHDQETKEDNREPVASGDSDNAIGDNDGGRDNDGGGAGAPLQPDRVGQAAVPA